MAIDQNISAFPTAPNSTTDTPTEFNAKADAYVNHQSNVFTGEVNQWAAEANALAVSIENIVATIPDGAIDDTTPSAINTYSSNKIEVLDDQNVKKSGSTMTGELVAPSVALTSGGGGKVIIQSDGVTTTDDPVIIPSAGIYSKTQINDLLKSCPIMNGAFNPASTGSYGIWNDGNVGGFTKDSVGFMTINFINPVKVTGVSFVANYENTLVTTPTSFDGSSNLTSIDIKAVKVTDGTFIDPTRISFIIFGQIV